MDLGSIRIRADTRLASSPVPKHTARMQISALFRNVLASAVTVLLFPAGAAIGQQSAHPDAATMQRIYGQGTNFGVFLADAVRRKELWDANWAKSDPAEAFVARAQALDGRYRILVVAVDSCSDSVNTIPYVARLVALVDRLEMQIVKPGVGKLLMDTYRTPDDRGATPTLVILDEGFEVVGAWVERPSPLQDWWVSHPEISDGEKARRKQGWYDWDEGYSTYDEIVGLLEVADSRR
jgi:hypothetical protein